MLGPCVHRKNKEIKIKKLVFRDISYIKKITYNINNSFHLFLKFLREMKCKEFKRKIFLPVNDQKFSGYFLIILSHRYSP